MDSVVDSALARERALRLQPDVFGSARTDASTHRSRWPVLRRHLLAGDAIAMSVGAIVGAAVAGTSAIEAAACAAALTLCWILVGWVIGVYAGDELPELVVRDGNATAATYCQHRANANDRQRRDRVGTSVATG